MNQGFNKRLSAACPLPLPPHSPTWTPARSEWQPSFTTTPPTATQLLPIALQKMRLALLQKWNNNNTASPHMQQQHHATLSSDELDTAPPQTSIPTPPAAGTTSWMQDLDSDYEMNGIKEKNPTKMTNQSCNQHRQQLFGQDSAFNNNNKSRNNHHANFRRLLPRDPTATTPAQCHQEGGRQRRFFLPTSRSMSFLENSNFCLSNIFPSSSSSSSPDNNNNNKGNDNDNTAQHMYSQPPLLPKEGATIPSSPTTYHPSATATTEMTAKATAATQRFSSPLSISPPTSLPLVRTQSIHLNRHQHQRQYQQDSVHTPPVPPPLPPRRLYNNSHLLLQVDRSEPIAIATAATATTTTAPSMTAATIRTSVDLSTLIAVPTKLHIDRHNLGRDERSKILASLQLAIERAQTYRDDLLQQEPALLSTITGHTTTTTATQFAYQQKQQGFQDYQNSYIDNDINQQQHQYQQEQQQQQSNASDHHQHQYINDMHNNLHPHFQNHQYHPPLSPGHGMMSMGDAAACMSVPSYASYHHHLYRHGYPQLIAHTHPCHPQQKQHLPYLPIRPCGCDTPSFTTTPTAISATTHRNHHQGPHSGSVPYQHHLPCPAIEMLLRASAQSTEARAVEEQRNMVRTKWAAILYTAISTLGILFACALDEKTSDRITFVVMYLLGLIVPIYALVDFGITRSQQSRETTTTTAAAAAAAATTASTTTTANGTNSDGGVCASANNATTPPDTKNRHADEEALAFLTGAFIHHI